LHRLPVVLLSSPRLLPVQSLPWRLGSFIFPHVIFHIQLKARKEPGATTRHVGQVKVNNCYTLFALCCLVSAEVTPFLSSLILALYPVQVHVMSRRPSRQMSAFSAEGLGEHIYEGDGPRRPSVQSVVQASSLKPGAQLTISTSNITQGEFRTAKEEMESPGYSLWARGGKNSHESGSRRSIPDMKP
jgi:hypothetical protein